MPVPASNRPTPPSREDVGGGLGVAPPGRAAGESRADGPPARARSRLASSPVPSSARQSPACTGQQAERARSAAARLVGDQRRRRLVGRRARTRRSTAQRRPRRRSRAAAAPRRRGRPRAAASLREHARRSSRRRAAPGGRRPAMPSSSARSGSAWRSSSGQSRSAASSVSNHSLASGARPARRGAGGQVLAVEGDVVPDEDGVAGERPEAGEASANGGAPARSASRDADHAGDEEGDRHAGIDERRKRSTIARSWPEADGADVDDAVAQRVEAGGLGVERRRTRVGRAACPAG